MKKQYTHNQVVYGSSGKAWKFTSANGFEFKTPLVGGRETADKVARVISGSLSRTKGISLDNLGRANIRQIQTNAGLKTFVYEPLFTASA